MIKIASAVAVGGGLGSVLRFFISSIVALHWSRHYYMGTLLVNWIGCLGIGFCSVYFLSRSDLSPVWRNAVTVGVLGGLTTFSSFSLDVLTLYNSGRGLLALVYLLASVLGGLVLAALGMTLARV